MSDCTFCKIIKKQIPADFVYENDKIVAFLDIHPNNPGHTLVVPKEHHADILETPDDVILDIMSRTKKIAASIMKAVGAQGFNIICNTKPAAGQIIFHTHFHIIPRFTNDGLRHWPEKHLSAEELKNVAQRIKAELK